MRAAVYHGPRTPLVIEEVPEPQPGPGEVVIKIAGAGVCHSDVIKMEKGLFNNFNGPRTNVFGHENGGWVSAVGAGVTSVSEGDAVVVYTSPGCGTCTYCVTGVEQYCADKSRWNGTGVGGGFADYMLVRTERALVKLDRLDPKQAATLTDAGFTSYAAVHRSIPYFDPEQPVLVIGAGGLGSYAIKYLRILSGCPVVVVETDERKRAQALSYGATWAFDGRDPDVAQKIKDLSTDGRGVCAALDFVGIDPTLTLAIATTRPAGKVTQVGIGGGKAVIDAGATFNFGQVFEPHLSGSLKDLRDAITLFERGEVDFIPTEYAPLEKINDVIADLAAGKFTGRAVIDPALTA